MNKIEADQYEQILRGHVSVDVLRSDDNNCGESRFAVRVRFCVPGREIDLVREFPRLDMIIPVALIVWTIE